MRRDDSSEARVDAAAGDHDLDATGLELGAPLEQRTWRTVRTDDGLVVSNPEAAQHRADLRHGLVFGDRAVDDRDAWAGHRAPAAAVAAMSRRWCAPSIRMRSTAW